MGLVCDDGKILSATQLLRWMFTSNVTFEILTQTVAHHVRRVDAFRRIVVVGTAGRVNMLIADVSYERQRLATGQREREQHQCATGNGQKKVHGATPRRGFRAVGSPPADRGSYHA